MARLPFHRVLPEPPYVKRKQADKVLLDAGDYITIVLLRGDGQACGVTRTLKHFVRLTDTHYFIGGKARYPLVLDLFGHAFLPTVEILVLLRNALVSHVNDMGGLSPVGRYLFDFDALYKIWRETLRIDPRAMVPLVQTNRRKLGRGIVKAIISFASIGSVEFVAEASELAKLGHEIAWETKAAIDVGREKAVDRLFERVVKDVQGFIDSYIAPKLSRRLRAQITVDKLNPADIPKMMQEVLINALLYVQDDLRDRGRFLLAIDAVDQAEDDDDTTVAMRHSVANVAIATTQSIGSAIICGRHPASRWEKEIENYEPKCVSLSHLDPDQIRDTLAQAGLDEEAIEHVLVRAGAPQPIFAGRLTEAYREVAGAMSGK